MHWKRRQKTWTFWCNNLHFSCAKVKSAKNNGFACCLRSEFRKTPINSTYIFFVFSGKYITSPGQEVVTSSPNKKETKMKSGVAFCQQATMCCTQYRVAVVVDAFRCRYSRYTKIVFISCAHEFLFHRRQQKWISKCDVLSLSVTVCAEVFWVCLPSHTCGRAVDGGTHHDTGKVLMKRKQWRFVLIHTLHTGPNTRGNLQINRPQLPFRRLFLHFFVSAKLKT